MKVAVIKTLGKQSVAVEHDGSWYDLGQSGETPLTAIEPILMQGLFSEAYFLNAIESIKASGRLAHPIIPPPTSFALPLMPGKIVAVGRNYLAHAQETGHDAPAEPMFFGKSTQACIAHGEPIVAKPEYGRVDHEAELAIVIGKRATAIREADANDYIVGYTLLNDVTARDVQKKAIEERYPWYLSKGMDTFCPLGPVIVPKESMPWPVIVDIELRVNGEIRQKSNTAKFIFSIPTLLAHITRFITLHPGDVVATGTPEGISPIKAGDIVEMTVPEIGTLSNPVVAQ